MAEDRPGTRNEHRRHPPTLAREEVRRDERVNAAVEAIEATAGRAMPDRCCRQSDIAELAQTEYAVLTGRELSNIGVPPSLVEKRPLDERFSTSLVHAPMVIPEA